MPTLTDITLGDLSVDEARKAVRDSLTVLNADSAERVYRAFRGWTWKALFSRRRDPELVEWARLISHTESFVSRESAAYSAQLRTLVELLSETIVASKRAVPSEVLRRSHVREILMLLVSAHPSPVSRARILHATKLGQANLTRILNVLVVAGLAQRTTFGKAAHFRATQAGNAALVRAEVVQGEVDGRRVTRNSNEVARLVRKKAGIEPSAHAAHPHSRFVVIKEGKKIGPGFKSVGVRRLKRGKLSKFREVSVVREPQAASGDF